MTHHRGPRAASAYRIEALEAELRRPVPEPPDLPSVTYERRRVLDVAVQEYQRARRRRSVDRKAVA